MLSLKDRKRFLLLPALRTRVFGTSYHILESFPDYITLSNSFFFFFPSRKQQHRCARGREIPVLEQTETQRPRAVKTIVGGAKPVLSEVGLKSRFLSLNSFIYST